MAVKVVIGLDAPDSALAGYGANAKIALHRASSETGTYSAVTTIAIVALTYVYTYWDTAGDGTSWYKWRLENTGGTETGDWSPPTQGWDPAVSARNVDAYATLDALLLRIPTQPGANSTDRTARYLQALADARERVDLALGVPGLFFRDPQTGATTVRTYDGTGDDVLHVHGGILSLTAIRVKTSPAASWETVDVTDARLEYWANRGDPHNAPDGEPYDHVVFTGAGGRYFWPRVRRGVELTGAFGWDRPPRLAIDANIDEARRALSADVSFTGGRVGSPELGAPTSGSGRMPDSLWRLSLAFSRRHMCAV